MKVIRIKYENSLLESNKVPPHISALRPTRSAGQYTARIRSISTLDSNGPPRNHYYHGCNQDFPGGHPSQYCSGSSTLN